MNVCLQEMFAKSGFEFHQMIHSNTKSVIKLHNALKLLLLVLILPVAVSAEARLFSPEYSMHPLKSESLTSAFAGETSGQVMYPVASNGFEKPVEGASNGFVEEMVQPDSLDADTTAVIKNPRLKVGLTSSSGSFDEASESILYVVKVENTGNVVITDISVKDLLGVIDSIIESLDVKDSRDLTGNYQVKQDDLDRGSISNTATATGNYENIEVVNAEDNVDIPALQKPALSLEKKAASSDFSSPGDLLSYNITVENAGNVTLRNIDVADPLAEFSERIPSLSPKENKTYGTSYNVTQDDLNRGYVDNTATASGIDPNDNPVTTQATAKVNAALDEELGVSVSATPLTYSKVGDELGLSIAVVNTGNVAVNNITVSESHTGYSTSIPTLPAGNTSNLPHTYTINQADLDNGSVTFLATAAWTGTDGENDSRSGSLVVNADQDPELSLTKTASPASFSTAGQNIQFSFLVKNEGNLTVRNITISDPLLNYTVNVGELQPGQQVTRATTYPVTQEDINSGGFTNTATVKGLTTGGTEVEDDDSATVTASTNSSLSLVKTASPSSFSKVGEEIKFMFTVTNEGNVPLTNVVVTDQMISLTNNVGNLQPGQENEFSGSYFITQEDLDNGGFTNSATVTGRDPSNNEVTDDASVDVTTVQNRELRVTKTATPTSYSAAGEVISYRIFVENIGNVTLTNIDVSDPKTGYSTVINSLAPGGSRELSTQYTVTQADMNSGSILNRATATAQSTTASGDAEVLLAQAPGLNVSMSASPGTFSSPDDEITFQITYENTGNVALENLTVTDALTGLKQTVDPLPAGSSRNITRIYAVTQSDIDEGRVTNLVTVENNLVSESATASSNAARDPGLSVTKSASPETYTAVGNEISYTIVVQNSGNVTLSELRVTDQLTGGNATIGSLAPGASRTFNETYRITASDMEAGSVVNTVNVSGTAPGNNTVTGSASAEVTALGPPVANDDTSSDHNSGEIVVINILENDRLQDGSRALPNLVDVDINPAQQGIQHELSVSGTGVWKYNPGNGELTFSPAAGFTTDPEPIMYILTEKSTGRSDEATVTIDYNEGEPFAVNDNTTGHSPGSTVTINILANDRLSDGTQATPEKVTIDLSPNTEGTQHEITVTGEGTWSYNASNGQVTFTPRSGFTTNPTPAVYRLTENLTGLYDDATITIGYNETAPLAADDENQGNLPGTSVAVNILANDRLSDGSIVLPLLVRVDLNINQSGVQHELTVEGEGRWVYNALTGVLLFIPATGFTVDPTPVTYRLTEILTGLSAEATVTIRYERKPPVAADDTSNGNTIGESVNVEILNNDKLSDGSEALPLLVSVDIDVQRQGRQTTLEIEGEGTWNYNDENGVLTFTPEDDFSGDPAPLQYALTEVSTGLSDEATVNVGYNRGAPIAVDDTSTGNPQGEPVAVDILANDRMSDGTAASPGTVVVDIDLEADGAQNQLTVDGEGVWEYNTETGVLTFTPLDEFEGNPATLRYSLCHPDEPSLCSQANVNVQYEQVVPEPGIALIKTGIYSSVDETVIYRFNIINTGNTELRNITVSDQQIGIENFKTVPDVLASGESVAVNFTYELTDADKLAGSVTNTATVEAFTPEGQRVEDISGTAADNDEPTVTTFDILASVLVEKETVFNIPEAVVNQLIDFRIIVTNNGSIPLTEIVVADPLTGLEEEEERLLPGESFTYITSYTVRQADGNRGQFENMAMASGKAPEGSIVRDSSSVIVRVESCELVVPTGFSPNGDGIQDYWRIQCIENYPDARVEVFNRWGNRVYERDNFGNSDIHGTTDAWWDGSSSNKATFGSGKLPAGTYYYILDLRDGSSPLSGFIFLNR